MSNSLASVHPELISEWSEKNLPLTPDKITFGSNKRVWWIGACGHEWETSVKARSKGEKCPICSGARVIEGINDLATLKPLLAQEWSKKNKLEFLNCACKYTEATSNLKEDISKRKEIKKLIGELKKNNPNVDYNIFKSLDNVNLNCILGTKKDGVYSSFLDK